jgi:hypothetical protein
VTLTVRRTLAAAAATTALAALAGCGGDDAEKAADTSSSSSATPSASPTPDDSTSASTGESDAPSAGDSVSTADFAAVMKNALDKATTAHVEMDLGGASGAGTAEGDADYTATPPEIAMTMDLAELGGQVEVRMVEGTMYLKAATFGDKWVSFPLDDPSSPLGGMADLFDVTKTLENFAAAVTSASHDTQDVDGESLDHYTATVDTEKLLASMPSAAGAAGSLPGTVTQEWWFDGDGLIRKFSGDFGPASTSMTFSDWGAEVDIEAPPSDEVTSMPGMGTAGS